MLIDKTVVDPHGGMSLRKVVLDFNSLASQKKGPSAAGTTAAADLHFRHGRTRSAPVARGLQRFQESFALRLLSLITRRDRACAEAFVVWAVVADSGGYVGAIQTPGSTKCHGRRQNR